MQNSRTLGCHPIWLATGIQCLTSLDLIKPLFISAKSSQSSTGLAPSAVMGGLVLIIIIVIYFIVIVIVIAFQVIVDPHIDWEALGLTALATLFVPLVRVGREPPEQSKLHHVNHAIWFTVRSH